MHLDLKSYDRFIKCYFWIVNSDLFGKIIHADYFLSMDSTRTNMGDLVPFFLRARVLERALQIQGLQG